MIGALTSSMIELLQLITGLMAGMTFRIADINDVITNSLGVVLGYSLFLLFVRIVRHLFRKKKSRNPVLEYILDRPQGNE